MNGMKKFGPSFWAANTMELFERWAYYGMFLIIALYLTGPKETGALEFSQTQKGWMLGIVTAVLYILPLFTGAIADRVGYKISLLISQIILASGYTLMGHFTSFSGMFMIFLYLAIGAALFKPIIAATITKTTTPETSSLGFGIYYMIINVGGFIGPAVASKLRENNWKLVFIGSSIAILVNIIILFLFYKEPPREKSTEPLGKVIKTILSNSFHVFGDFKLIFLLIIIIGFWSVYWQLFFTLPGFIDQWVDTSPVYITLSHFSGNLAYIASNGHGSIAPEMIVNLGAATIILFQILVSYFSGKLKPVIGILLGIVVNVTGMTLAFLSCNIWLIILSVVIGAFGEMMCSPRVIEYLGRIAPPNKTAAYIGSSYMPMALGNVIAGFLSGPVYEAISDKYSLLGKEFMERFPGFSLPKSNLELLNQFITKTGLTSDQTNLLLWTKYQPYKIAFIFLAIGVFTSISLWIYNRYVVKG